MLFYTSFTLVQRSSVFFNIVFLCLLPLGGGRGVQKIAPIKAVVQNLGTPSLKISWGDLGPTEVQCLAKIFPDCSVAGAAQ